MIEIDVGDCDLTTFARAEPEEPKNPSIRHLKFKKSDTISEAAKSPFRGHLKRPKKGSNSERMGRPPIRVGNFDLHPAQYPPTAPRTTKAIAIYRDPIK